MTDVGDERDSGGAIVEFILMSIVLLVPLVYLVTVISHVQAATFAVELAAREAARAAVVEGVRTVEQGGSVDAAMNAASSRAGSGTALVLEDFGFDLDRVGSLELTCGGGACFAPGTTVEAEVSVDVEMPWLPGFVQAWAPSLVHVETVSRATVDDYGGLG